MAKLDNIVTPLIGTLYNDGSVIISRCNDLTIGVYRKGDAAVPEIGQRYIPEGWPLRYSWPQAEGPYEVYGPPES